MEANAGKSFQMQIFFNIIPRISLHCKLVPVRYWEYEYGLLNQHDLFLKWRIILHCHFALNEVLSSNLITLSQDLW